jgi:hypothetical protein
MNDVVPPKIPRLQPGIGHNYVVDTLRCRASTGAGHAPTFECATKGEVVLQRLHSLPL